MSMQLHKGSIRLAGLYLAIIMAISLFFSLNIYQLSLNELDHGLRGPAGAVRPIGPGFSEDIRNQIQAERQELYDEARDHVLQRLVVVNLFILIGGGVLSYYLALRTLKPIEEAHEAQNRFTADASHELRTPITAMMTENEVTLMDPSLSLNDAKKQLVSNIEELQHLSTLADGLMRLAGLESAGLNKEQLDVVTLVRAAIERVQPRADAKSIVINFKTPKNVKLSVLGDVHNLQEVITILLDNAIKYSAAHTTISVGAKQDQKNIIITVADKGIGISSSDLPHVFERFYRADLSRTKQAIHGYGLGLAIAKDIIEKHDGTISVRSAPQKGSTFTITLPGSS